MKSIKIRLFLLMLLTLTMFSSVQVFADIDSYVVYDEQSKEYYKYSYKEIIEGYKKFKRYGESEVISSEFLEKIKENNISSIYDDSGKYIDYNKILDYYKNQERNNEQVDLNTFLGSAQEAKKPEYVFERVKSEEKVSNILNITGDNVEEDLSGKELKGFRDIVVTGKNVVIKNAQNVENLTINSDKDASICIKGSKIGKIKFLSGKLVELDGVTSDNLIIDSKKQGSIQCKNETDIQNTLVNSSVELSTLSGSCGNIKVSMKEDKNGVVKLKGRFNEPIIIESGVTLKTEKNTVIKQVNISPNSKASSIKLSGNFNSVVVNKEAKVNIISGSINEVVTNTSTSLNVGKNAKVKAVYNRGNKVTKTGEGKVQKEEKEKKKENTNISSGGSSHGGGGGSSSGGSSSSGGGSSQGGTTNPTHISVEKVSLDKKSISMVEGDTEKLTAAVSPSNATNKNVRWTTSDKKVAVVENGLVKAVSEGTATITVTSEDGNKTASCTVKVSKKVISVEKVSLDKESISMLEGDTEKLTAAVSPSNATNKNVTWTTSDKKVAVVENGLIKAVSEGTAVITVTSEDGNKTAKCTINVKEFNVKVNTQNNFVSINIEEQMAKDNPTAIKIVNKDNGNIQFFGQYDINGDTKEAYKFITNLESGKYFAGIKVKGTESIITRDFEIKLTEAFQRLLKTIKKAEDMCNNQKKYLDSVDESYKISLKTLWEDCNDKVIKLRTAVTTASAITTPGAITVNEGVSDEKSNKVSNDLEQLVKHLEDVSKKLIEAIKETNIEKDSASFIAEEKACNNEYTEDAKEILSKTIEETKNIYTDQYNILHNIKEDDRIALDGAWEECNEEIKKLESAVTTASAIQIKADVEENEISKVVRELKEKCKKFEQEKSLFERVFQKLINVRETLAAMIKNAVKLREDTLIGKKVGNVSAESYEIYGNDIENAKKSNTNIATIKQLNVTINNLQEATEIFINSKATSDSAIKIEMD